MSEGVLVAKSYSYEESYGSGVLRAEAVVVAVGATPIQRAVPKQLQWITFENHSSGDCGTILHFLVRIILVLAFSLGIPISMIVMGAMYLEDCEAEHMIPIYLIVAGSFGCAEILYRLWRLCINDKDDDSSNRIAMERFVLLFLFAWFIAGSVYIYQITDIVQSDRNKIFYCDPTLYWYSFGMNIFLAIVIGIFLLGCFCSKE